MKWFRFYTEIRDDPKMRKLEDDEYRVFTYLLAIAAEEEKGGIVPYNTEDLSWTLRAPVDLVVRTIAKLTTLNILSPNGEGWKFTHWQVRQFPSDNVTERTRRYRAKENETFPEAFQERSRERIEREIKRDREIDISSSPPETETIPQDTQSCCVSHNECPHEAIVSLYHEILPELPAVKKWTTERKKQLRARWREEPKRQNLEWWRQYFELVKKTPFLMGRNKTNWTPNLEWLVKERNLLNVIEETYHE